MKGGKFLDKARSAFKLRQVTKLVIPEWDNLEIHIKQPSAGELQRVVDKAEGRLMEQAARLVALCARDDSGDRLFSDAEYRTFMDELDWAPVQRIANAIMELIKVDGSTAGVEDAAKN